MLSLRVAPTKNLCNSLGTEMHECKYKMAKAKMSGPPPWRKYMKPNDFLPRKARTTKEQKVEGKPAELEPVPVEIPKPSAFWLSCPECGMWMDKVNVTLLSRGKWGALKCEPCNRAFSASKWKCVCNVRWIACQAHCKMALACGTKHKSSMPRRSKWKSAFFRVDQEGFPLDPGPKCLSRPRKCLARESPPTEIPECNDEDMSAQPAGGAPPERVKRHSMGNTLYTDTHVQQLSFEMCSPSHNSELPVDVAPPERVKRHSMGTTVFVEPPDNIEMDIESPVATSSVFPECDDIDMSVRPAVGAPPERVKRHSIGNTIICGNHVQHLSVEMCSDLSNSELPVEVAPPERVKRHNMGTASYS
jgi:hypothetical protein